MIQDMLDAIRSTANANQYSGLISNKQLYVVNKVLDTDFPERSERLNFLRLVFNRRNISSSKDLSKREASALIAYMYIDNWETSPYWKDFTKEVKNTLKTVRYEVPPNE